MSRWQYHRVPVKDSPVNWIENVAGDNGRYRHCAPVLAHTVHSKSVRHNAGETAKQEAICESSNTRDRQ